MDTPSWSNFAAVSSLPFAASDIFVVKSLRESASWSELTPIKSSAYWKACKSVVLTPVCKDSASSSLAAAAVSLVTSISLRSSFIPAATTAAIPAAAAAVGAGILPRPPVNLEIPSGSLTPSLSATVSRTSPREVTPSAAEPVESETSSSDLSMFSMAVCVRPISP